MFKQLFFNGCFNGVPEVCSKSLPRAAPFWGAPRQLKIASKSHQNLIQNFVVVVVVIVVVVVLVVVVVVLLLFFFLAPSPM